MKPQTTRSGFRFLSASVALFAGAAIGWMGNAYGGGNFRQSAVGGVMVNAEGLVRAATIAEREDFLNQLRAEVQLPDGELKQGTKMRMISLSKLQDAIRAAKDNGQSLPDEIRYLAGLQRVEFVFVYPEQNDIVLAGPAEPWIVREDASVVGAVSGQPTLLLDDLMVAMRSVETARRTAISCSIEPTAEGRQRLNALLRRVRLRPQQNPRTLEPAMREAFGPQTVKLTGVPTDSRYARVLVAADFEMKRLAMQLVEAPIAGFPSYMEMARNQRQSSSTNPRWWMTTNYDALERTEDRLAWRIRGQGVKTLTETDRLVADGNVEQTGKSDKLAQKWAELMTDKFSELTKAQPIFGELRNIMDLTVIATLVNQERLDQQSGCDLAVLMGTDDVVDTHTYETPAAIEPQCSFVRGTKGWTVSTSGGVTVNAFEVVRQQQVSAPLQQTRQQSTAPAERSAWWWDTQSKS